MCLKVQELASDMGYSVNTAASALKRKTLRIGVVLPEPVMENRFYYSALWTGIRKYMEGNEIFHGHVTEFYYPLIPGQHGETLKDVYENHLTDIDGLITIGVNRNESSLILFRRYMVPESLWSLWVLTAIPARACAASRPTTRWREA